MEDTLPDSEDSDNDEDKSYSLKKPNTFHLKDKNIGIHNDFIDTNYQPKHLEVHPDQDTEINNSFEYKYDSHYHNTSSQNTQPNPESKESRDLFPLLGDSSNIEAKNEDGNSTLQNKDRDKERQVLGKFDARTNEGNESKYLHIIDYDIQEPPQVIKNFGYSAADDHVRNPSKIEHIKESINLGEINNNSDEAFHEPRSKYTLNHESKRQLPDLLNPQRLHERQTKQQASPQNITGIDGGNDSTLQKGFRNTTEPGSKVKNLVHEYELQVMNEDRPRQDNRREKQSVLFPKIKNTVMISYDNEHQTKTEECRATNVRPLKLEKPSFLSGEVYHSGMNEPKSSYSSSNSHSKAKEGKNRSPSSLRSVEHSPDGSNTSAFRPIVKEHCLANSKNGNRSVNRSFPLDRDKLGAKHEQQTSISDPRVIKAHWYDIHSISRQSSRVIVQPSGLKKWKSLGELDRMEQAEEYKLPEQLSKTETYAPQQYFESNLHSRFQAIQNNQTLSSGQQANGRVFPSIGIATEAKSPSLSRKNGNVTGHTQEADNMFNSSLSFHSTRNYDNFGPYQSTHGTSDQSPMKRPPFMKRKHEQQVRNIDPPHSFQTTSDNASLGSSLSSWSTPNQAHIKQLPTSEIDQRDNNSSTLSLFHNTSGHDNLHSPSSSLPVNTTQSYIIRPPSPRKKREKPSEAIQNDSSLFHGITDHNNNLSSSLTALERIDQSPMRRSQKIKNLLNIEYYDINSDDELNSKMKRRPRTKSLNDQDKATLEYAPARREFKSSEDLRYRGLSQEEVNAESRDGETVSRVE